jgi:hypothetical protein
LFDGQGKILKNDQIHIEKNQPSTISTDQLNPGVYFIQAFINNSPIHFKFVKR